MRQSVPAVAVLHLCSRHTLVPCWVGEYGKAHTAVPQYSLLAADEGGFLEKCIGLVPGQPAADFRAIKNQTYREIMEFKPMYGAVKNRGYADVDSVNPKCQIDQVLQGVKHSPKVYQTSGTDSDGEQGGLLHEETGRNVDVQHRTSIWQWRAF
jgi:hypothetical protein